jgi:Arc/MetJ-type ribon-helix-helix transcriptional regulator
VASEKIPIYISKNLYEKVKERVEQSQGEFKSVEEYVEFVLSEIVKEEEEEKEVYTPEEEEEIKKRLRSLGYL